MLNKVIRFFTSLRLTVACLAVGVVLVFVGTLAQVNEGLYNAQNRWFRSFLIWWAPTEAGWSIPIFPGGYLVGVVLLVNLVTAHLHRLQRTWKKLGIHVTHLGVILLLVGQLATDLLSRETQMRFIEGEARNYSESGMQYELAFITDVGPDTEEVVAIPETLLAAAGAEFKHEKLPFTVRVKSYWRNSELTFRAPMAQHEPPLTTNGVARYFDFKPIKETHKMDDKNVPTAVIELTGPSGPLGTWVAPGWTGDVGMFKALWRSYRRQLGEKMADTMVARLQEPQRIEAGDRSLAFVMRPARTYHPFAITLLQTTHEVYRGTDIPKHFQSRVRVENPARREAREVDIYMNNPLRYEGLTFYQYQMDREEMDRSGRGVSVLQVVRNPSWLTPYLGCVMVGGGLVIQFMAHLIGFIKKRRTA